MAAGLERFVEAQDRDGSYSRALAELAAGRKVSHWMWWVFPQVAGLGSSPTSQRYALAGVDEACAYAAHPVLGARLAKATSMVLGCTRKGLDPAGVFGAIDAVKLCSCMTLFEVAAPSAGPWADVLGAWYGGARDPRTLELVGRA